MHEFVLCRVELEPSPTPVCFTCISMKQEVIYPSAAATSLSVSLSLSVQQTLISLPSKVTDSVFSSSKLSAFPFICTWERPWPHTLPLCVLPSAHGPPLYKALFACVCQCVSVWVGKWTCMSTLCVYMFLTLCLTSSVYFHEQVHAVLCRFTQMYSSLFKLLYIWESLHTLVLFKVFSVLQVCNWELLHTRTRQSSFGASVNRITGKWMAFIVA